MECKWRRTGENDQERNRINRYIMECKFSIKKNRQHSITELIDTLWNVNKRIRAGCDVGKHELIDTLWNVNAQSIGYTVPQIRELIDTLWNVNTIKLIIFYNVHEELIDTLWNVNFCQNLRHNFRQERINRYIMECKLLLTAKSSRRQESN